MPSAQELDDALHTYYNNPDAKGSLRRAAYLHRIPESSLRHRFHGRATLNEEHQNQRLLSTQQRQVVIDLIIKRDTWGFCLNYDYLLEIVISIAGLSILPGKNWATCFVANEPQLEAIFHKARDKQRHFATNYESFNCFFTLVR